MLTNHWGFQFMPFSDPTGAGFYSSLAVQEARARVQYLADQNYRLGILVGEPGVGKTILFNVLQRQLRTTGFDACVINVLGMQFDEFLVRLALSLGYFDFHLDRQTTAQVWQAIFDQIRLNSYQRRTTVILLDDADEADPEIRTAIRRLVQGVTHPRHRLTVVIGAQTVHVRRLGSSLVDLASLRVELWPWNPTEVAEYLHTEIQRAGGAGHVFTRTAAERISEISRGVPRRVCRLAELSLAAAAGQGVETIDESIVDAVSDELQLAVHV